MRLAQVAVLLAGCGRVGFDTRTAPGDGGHDGPVCATCDQGLIAHWRFDGNLVDDIAGHDVTLTSATLNSTGELGGSVDLQGGWAQVMWDLTADARDAFTIAMWVRIDPAAQAFDRYFSLFFYDDPTFRGAILMDNASGDGLRCAPYTGGNWTFVETDHDVAVGVWQHIACVYDGAQVAVYANAVQQAALPASGAFDTTQQLPLAIGASLDDIGNYQNEAHMGVDDVRVYNRALTQAELTALASP
jgi:hypothetical protein